MDDPQRFIWLGSAAAKGGSGSFLNEMSNQMRNFSSGTGHSSDVFAIGRALKRHVDNEKRTVFGRSVWNFDTCIGPANQGLRFYQFQLQCYRKAVGSWTIVGSRNRAVKDIRRMIGKMIWDAREEAVFAYSEEKQSSRDIRAEKRARLRK
jgi:hypothetical protein